MVGKERFIAIKDREGNLVNEKSKMIDVISEYYSSLYEGSNDNIDITDKLIGFTGEVPDILEDEVKWAIKSMRKGKAGGSDGIIIEELLAGGDTIVKTLTHLSNLCLRARQVSDKWLEAQVILLYKKGDKKDMENYRPISLLPVMYKVLMKIVSRRIEKPLDQMVNVNQTGGRKNVSTLDNILVLKYLIRRAHEYNFPLALVFVDYRKAFDTVNRSDIIQTLINVGIDKDYVKLIKYIYDGARMEMKIDNESRVVKVDKGTRQGDVLSGKIFVSVLEEACNKLEWDGMGININGKWLNMLKFMDDIVLIGKSMKEVEKMMVELMCITGKVGLEINKNKTKMLTVNLGEQKGLQIGSEEIERVKEYIYLGTIVSCEKNGQDKEVSRRITNAWKAYNKYRYLFRSNVDMHLKSKLWSTCVAPVFMYGTETWTITKEVVRKIQIAQRMMERSMLKITRKERKSNSYVRRQTLLEDIGISVMTRKWKWAGHIARTNDERWSKEIIDWCPRERKRGRGRPKQEWDEEMRKVCGGVTWQRVARDRVEWRRMTQVYCDVWL